MKKLIIFILSMVIVLGCFTIVLADESTGQETGIFEEQLELLMSRGLIKGDENGNLNLNKGLTRVEGATVYSRIFEMEEEIKKFEENNPTFNTPFIDIPGWAADTINYLYSTNVIKGISDTEFGSNDLMTDVQFTTMILRGLGHDDSKGDFEWNKSLDKAVELGMIDESLQEEIEEGGLFSRNKMVKLTYYTLYPMHNNKEQNSLEYERFYVELTDVELDELRLRKDKLFDDNPTKQKELFAKLHHLVKKSIDEYTVILNGEIHPLELGNVTNFGYNGGLEISFNTGNWLKLELIDNRVVIKSDYNLNMFIFIEAQNSVAHNDERLRKATDPDSSGSFGTFPVDVNKFDTTIYADGIKILNGRTVNFDEETLVFEIEVK